MRNIAYISSVLLFTSTATMGCFFSRKETVREVPASTTTIERRSSVETVPPSVNEDVVRKRTTVETTY